MNELLAKIIDAHGGMERWNGHEKVDATIVSGGGLFPLKGVPQDSNPRRMTVWLHEERSSVALWCSRSAHDVHLRQDRHREAQWHAGYRALRPQGLICWPSDEHTVGSAASCLFQRRGSMDLPHHALSSRDGPRANRGDELWREGAETWRVLRAYFPGSIETHCLVQDFFFGEDLLLRRHDYSVNIAGGFRAAQLTSDYAEANGIRLPTKRRAYTRGPDRRPILEMLMVSIDISDVSFA